jgi:hypothetical protein
MLLLPPQTTQNKFLLYEIFWAGKQNLRGETFWGGGYGKKDDGGAKGWDKEHLPYPQADFLGGNVLDEDTNPVNGYLLPPLGEI